MRIEDVIAELHSFRETIIIGNSNDRERVKACYSSLSKKEYDSKMFKYVLCGDITELFLSLLRTKGLNGKPIFIWNHLIQNQHELILDPRYILAIAENDSETINEYEGRLIFDEVKEGSHGIFELNLDSMTYTVDAKVGLIYSVGIEELLKGKGIYESWRFMDQYKYILNSYHMGRSYTHIYGTWAYWSHVKVYYYTPELPTPYVDYFLRERND